MVTGISINKPHYGAALKMLCRQMHMRVTRQPRHWPVQAMTFRTYMHVNILICLLLYIYSFYKLLFVQHVCSCVFVVALSKFEKTANRDCAGDDIEQMANTTPEDCAARCLGLDECVAFDFNTGSKSCWPTRICESTYSHQGSDAYILGWSQRFIKEP